MEAHLAFSRNVIQGRVGGPSTADEMLYWAQARNLQLAQVVPAP